MREALINWLKGDRNYAMGVELYLRYGKDTRLLSCFKEPLETDFKKKKLLEVIKELAGAAPKPVTVIQKTTLEVSIEKTWPKGAAGGELDALRQEWRPKYGELTNLQARIHDIAQQGISNPNKRLEAKQMAERIVQLNYEIIELYAEKEYFLKHGYLPKKEVIIPSNIPLEQAFNRKKNLERYLRDLANKLNRPDLSEVKTKKWFPKWSEYVQEIRELNKRLNRPENEGIPER